MSPLWVENVRGPGLFSTSAVNYGVHTIINATQIHAIVNVSDATLIGKTNKVTTCDVTSIDEAIDYGPFKNGARENRDFRRYPYWRIMTLLRDRVNNWCDIQFLLSRSYCRLGCQKPYDLVLIPCAWRDLPFQSANLIIVVAAIR